MRTATTSDGPGLRLLTTPYGPTATQLLVDTVAAAKAGDPLAAATIVVPNNYTGVATRRALGRSRVAGAGAGVAGVNFLTLFRLGELLGGTALARRRLRPVSTAVLTAAVRRVLADEPGLFESVRQHPATERALVAAHRELGDVPAPALDRLGSRSPRAAEVVRIHRRLVEVLRSSWYDEHDLLTAATTTVRADPASVAWLGTIVVHLPQLIARPAAELVRALASARPVLVIVGLTGVSSADLTVTRSLDRLGLVEAGSLAGHGPDRIDRAIADEVVGVSDPDEEVRTVIRRVVDAMREGVPLDAMAILHGAPEPYARILHEQLAAAEIPSNGTAPRTLAESLLGRTLLDLLSLSDHDYRRADVMALLTSSPIRDGGRPIPASAWERISREAAVIQGSDWESRLHRLADDKRREAEREAETEGRDWLIERLERAARRADHLRAFVGRLMDDTGAERLGDSWRRAARNVRRLVERSLGDDRSDWPAIEVAAAEKVEAALDRLAVLDAVDDPPTAAVFRRTLEQELAASLGRVGRLGNGVLVGPPSVAVGLDMERVFVVGMAEGTFPARVRDDSLMPDRERAAVGLDLPPRSEAIHDQHRQFLAAIAGAKRAVLTWPRGDLRRSAERLPSRWLLDSASALAGTPLTASDLGSGEWPWLRTSPSHVAGLAATAFPSTSHEYDLRVLLDHDRGGGTIDDHPAVTARPSLVRGVDLVRSRRSRAFTRFDGNLASVAITSPADAGEVLSPTRLETWAVCPHQFLFRHILRVEPVEDPDAQLELSPLDRGSIVHDVLDRFVSEVLARPAAGQPEPGQPWTAADRLRLGVLAEAAFAEVERRGVMGKPVFWRRSRADIARELGNFLSADDRHRAESGARLLASELGFGVSAARSGPVTWTLSDRRTLRFRGSADRVDRLSDGGLAVLDYKTGSTFAYRKLGPADPDQRGTRLQLPIYALAARAAVGEPRAPVRAAYWFVSDRGKYEQRGYELTPEIE
ncbi:MAG: PD-(D/E)XK nuclease family protein, partial [Acidimicrobiia bacterium]|nr:PD-(D/E)XK nuclease family protein [Acidimicrobiia bacterium]